MLSVLAQLIDTPLIAKLPLGGDATGDVESSTGQGVGRLRLAQQLTAGDGVAGQRGAGLGGARAVLAALRKLLVSVGEPSWIGEPTSARRRWSRGRC